MSKLDHFSNAELCSEDLDTVSGGNWWCHWKPPCEDKKDRCDWKRDKDDCDRDRDHDRKRKHGC